MLQALPVMPLVLPSDPNYQEVMSSLKEQMSVLSDEGGKKIHGLSPCILDGTVMEGEIRLPSGETRRVKATQFTAINDKTIDKIDLIQAIREKRIVAFYYDNGICQDVSMHHKWCDWIEKEKASTIARRIEMGGKYTIPKGDREIGLADLSEDSYLRMVVMLGYETYLQASKENDTEVQDRNATVPNSHLLGTPSPSPVLLKTTPTPPTPLKSDGCAIL